MKNVYSEACRDTFLMVTFIVIVLCVDRLRKDRRLRVYFDFGPEASAEVGLTYRYTNNKLPFITV